MKTDVQEFIAIGLGPFNLSLACLAEPIADLDGIFLERNTEFSWHPGMLIDNATLQNPFLADLVSLADPTSRFSFLNYCKAEGKIYSYYFRENFYLKRAEYNAYCRWAAAQLSNVRFSCDVQEVVHDLENGCYVVTGVQGPQREPFVLRCRKLVLGVGSRPVFPQCCEPAEHRFMHAADYLANKAQLQQKRSITIVGSGQSAAEVFHDLLKEADAHDYSLTWITRSPRFFQMETTKLTLEMFSPDYIDYFFHLDEQKKERIVRTQDSLYKGVNASLINQIYDLLDDKRNEGRLRTHLITNCELQGCRYDAAGDGYDIEFRQLDCETRYAHRSEGVVFATGYRENIPPFIDGIRHRLRWDEKGRYRLARNYAADFDGNEIFVQNAGQHTHGMTNQDLGMSCYRNSYILRELTGVEHYKIERRIALQDFAIPATADFVRL
ncbi:SidA/IucD/PvdA family monooxygenase [Variovorax sp. J22G21]|uniref:lysine N(6)-hydroxylase/L-ornithine N(5)-oxygenase family protein n=1 Tax=Variovorax fucosicus TaxID=3053517 RepID=UPI002576857F|nr:MULTISPECIES: SidA/IucD/PvdA family monooxygenase [unclassified Variovorax]MDM0037580.1 SidA/IucD/PvdA family monooxygenase [Variovorax sp. J22R193]MDM0062356.1 SidA/IucD/PvdA family monooxygenase [Variovorax sp. J22G21]